MILKEGDFAIKFSLFKENLGISKTLNLSSGTFQTFSLERLRLGYFVLPNSAYSIFY